MTLADWYPFFIVAGGGLVWTLLCIWAGFRWEKHDGPLSYMVIPVMAGMVVLVVLAEWLA